MIKIEGFNTRDVSYILAHCRALDREEIWCQFQPGVSNDYVTAWVMQSAEGFIARFRGLPVAAFGLSRTTFQCAHAWAFGSDRMRYAVPAISRFFITALGAAAVKSGIKSVEARSLASHHEAHVWMFKLGARCIARLPDYGTGGQDFLLFRWTVEDFQRISRSGQRRFTL